MANDAQVLIPKRCLVWIYRTDKMGLPSGNCEDSPHKCRICGKLFIMCLHHLKIQYRGCDNVGAWSIGGNQSHWVVCNEIASISGKEV